MSDTILPYMRHYSTCAMLQPGEAHRGCTCGRDKAAAKVAALRAVADAKHDALVTMAMFLTNVNTINEQSQLRLVQQLVVANEPDLADALAEAGFAAALDKLGGDK